MGGTWDALLYKNVCEIRHFYPMPEYMVYRIIKGYDENDSVDKIYEDIINASRSGQSMAKGGQITTIEQAKDYINNAANGQYMAVQLKEAEVGKPIKYILADTHEYITSIQTFSTDEALIKEAKDMQKSGFYYPEVEDEEEEESEMAKGGKVDTSSLEGKKLSEIAQIIRKDWKNMYFGAVPYVDAMSRLDYITNDFYADSGRSIVAYFLGNAQSWRGDTAKIVKAYLNKLLKDSYARGGVPKTAGDMYLEFERIDKKILRLQAQQSYATARGESNQALSIQEQLRRLREKRQNLYSMVYSPKMAKGGILNQTRSFKELFTK